MVADKNALNKVLEFLQGFDLLVRLKDEEVFYLLGNMATLSWSDTVLQKTTEKHIVLQWRASNKQLRDIVATEVDKIERFSPACSAWTPRRAPYYLPTSQCRSWSLPLAMRQQPL